MSKDEATKNPGPRLIVGVGASAGGLQAFKELMEALPGGNGMAFLLVQHLDPTHKSMLAELLAQRTKMIVADADQGQRLEADHVYVICPDSSMAVHDGRIQLTPPTLHRGVKLPVDHLFRSLAEEYRERLATTTACKVVGRAKGPERAGEGNSALSIRLMVHRDNPVRAMTSKSRLISVS